MLCTELCGVCCALSCVWLQCLDLGVTDQYGVDAVYRNLAKVALDGGQPHVWSLVLPCQCHANAMRECESAKVRAGMLSTVLRHGSEEWPPA